MYLYFPDITPKRIACSLKVQAWWKQWCCRWQRADWCIDSSCNLLEFLLFLSLWIVIFTSDLEGSSSLSFGKWKELVFRCYVSIFQSYENFLSVCLIEFSLVTFVPQEFKLLSFNTLCFNMLCFALLLAIGTGTKFHYPKLIGCHVLFIFYSLEWSSLNAFSCCVSRLQGSYFMLLEMAEVSNMIIEKKFG